MDKKQALQAWSNISTSNTKQATSSNTFQLSSKNALKQWESISPKTETKPKTTLNVKKVTPTTIPTIVKPTITPVKTEKLVIQPKQNKLTKEQMATIPGMENTKLIAAPKETTWQKLTNKINNFFNPDTDVLARAQNAYSLQKSYQKKIGVKLDLNKLNEKGGNILKNSLAEDVSRELGLRTTPTTKEVSEAVMTIAGGLGLIEAPLQTLKFIASFTGVNELKSGLISVLKGKPKLGAGYTLSDIVPNAPTDVKNVLDLVDFIGTAKASEKLMRTQPKILERLTKDTIVKYKLRETVNIPAEEVKRVVIGNNTGREKEILSKLGLTGEQWKKAISDGVSVEVPAEKITTLTDKPYWKKLKSLLGKEATNITTSTVIGETTKAPKGLLKPGEYAPQEVINKVMEAGGEKTVEGKALIKEAVDAQASGQNVLVEKPQAYTPIQTTPPVSPIAKTVSGKVVGAKPKEVVAKPQSIEKLQKKELPAKEIQDLSNDELQSLLKSDQALEAEGKDNEMARKARVEIEKIQTEIQQRQGENQLKASVLEMFSGSVIKKMRDVKRSVQARINKNMDPITVMETESYKTSILDVMAALNTDSQDEALRFIIDELPDAITSATTMEDLQKIKILKSRIKPKEIVTPRSQLPATTVGKEKISKLEARMKGVIGKATPEQIEQLGLTTYNQLNKQENIASAAKYVLENREEALRVLKGEVEAPKGILRNSIFVAMDNLAQGDTELAMKLASLQSTRLGQEISVLSEINKDSPVKAMYEIIKVREEAFKKRFGTRTVKEMKARVVKDIQAKVKKPDKYDWNNFISSLEC